MRFRPCSDSFIVPAPVLRVEVYKGHRFRLLLRLPPHLPEDTHIGVAHEHLPQDVQAVRRMNSHNVFAVHKCALLFRQIVLVVPMQGFAQEILRILASTLSAFFMWRPHQAVQMMQSFNIRWVSSTILLTDLDLIRTQTSLLRFFQGHHNTAV